MKIKLTKTVVVKGHSGVVRGDIIDVLPGLAATLVSERCAVFYEETEYEPTRIEVREPVIQNREPVIEEMPQRKSSSRRQPK